MENFDLDDKKKTKRKQDTRKEEKPKYQLRKRSVHADSSEKPKAAPTYVSESSESEEDVVVDEPMRSESESEEETRPAAAQKPKPRAKGRNWRKLEDDEQLSDEELAEQLQEEEEEQASPEVKPKRGSKAKAKDTASTAVKPKAFKTSLKREVSLGPVELDPGTVTVTQRGKFLEAWGAHIVSIQTAKYNGKKGKKKKQQDLKDNNTGRRNLDRVAWVLEKLAAGSVCVAVLEADDGVYAYANDSSNLATAIQTLNAYKDSGPSEKQMKEFEETVSGGRAPKKGANPRQRLQRACEVLRAIGKQLKAHANKTEGKHAELHALDVLLNIDQAKGGDIGISKLCCAKCYMALHAAGKETLISGAHFKTQGYGRWSVPHFLTGEDVMKKFLGGKAYDLYKDNPDGFKQVIATNEPQGVTGSNETDPVFSDEDM